MVFQHRFDGAILTLKESFSQKQIRVDIQSIRNFRLKEHPHGMGAYLNLVFNDGKEIVLCHAGLAFPPGFVNTSPLPDAPPVSCLQDYADLLNNLKALLRDSSQRQQALGLFNVLISILDGAKAVGLDVVDEEEKLNELLTAFEESVK